MKGAWLLAENADLFADAVAAMRRMPGHLDESDGFAQLRDPAGRYFTFFRDEAGTEWHDDPIVLTDGVEAPDLAGATAVWFECRWEDLVKLVIEGIQANLGHPAWVEDGNGVIWSASDVDPTRIQL